MTVAQGAPAPPTDGTVKPTSAPRQVLHEVGEDETPTEAAISAALALTAMLPPDDRIPLPASLSAEDDAALLPWQVDAIKSLSRQILLLHQAHRSVLGIEAMASRRPRRAASSCP